MAIPNSSLTELISTTIAQYSPKMADNVTKSNAILFRMNEKGNIRKLAGGTSILENLKYAENGTWKWYSGYETLDVSAQDVLTSAEYDWKQGNVNVTISGKELKQNKDSATRMHNLLKARIEVAEATAKNNVATSIFSTGATDPKEIGGLQLLVADDPTTGTVGGIDRAANAWWKNQIYDFSVAGLGAASATTIINAMSTLYRRCLRGTDRTDLIVADDTYFAFYESACTTLKRFDMSDTKLADAGFMSLKFNNADVIYDANCPSAHMYFLNTNFLGLTVHEDGNFSLDNEKVAVNQDALVYPLSFMGNMTMSNASLQGVMIA